MAATGGSFLRWCTGAGRERRVVGLHATHSAANALVNAGLIGSAIVGLDAIGRSDRLLGYLVFTLAPFAVAAPLIGMAVRRSRIDGAVLIRASFLVRSVLATALVLLATTPAAYPLLFASLVAQRVHTVSLYASVPEVVGDGPRRFHTNARLNRGAAVAGGMGGGIGGVLVAMFGPVAPLGLAAGVYLLCGHACLALRPLRRPVATSGSPVAAGSGAGADTDAAADMDAATGAVRTPDAIWRAAVVFAGTRSAAGAIAALLARSAGGGSMSWWAVVAIGGALGVGGVVGSIAGPHLLQRTGPREVRGTVGLSFLGAALAAALSPLAPLVAVTAGVIGFTGSLARQHRDERIQRPRAGGTSHSAFVWWDALAQAAWVGAAITVTAGALDLVGTASLVGGIAAVSSLALLRDPRHVRVPRPLPSVTGDEPTVAIA